MANMLFANNCNTTLSSSLTNVATTMSVTSATGFPSPTGSQYFYCTLADAATQTTIEIVKVTAVSGTTFTIVRGQDGTSGTAFASGAVVSLRLVRASLHDFPKLDEANTFTQAQTFSALTVGRIPFSGTGGLQTDDAALFWDNTNKRLGIGTGSPNARFNINNATASTTAMYIQGVAGNLIIDYGAGGQSYFDGSGINFRTYAGVTRANFDFTSANSAFTITAGAGGYALLTINSTGTAYNTFATNGTETARITADSSSNLMFSNTSSATERMRIFASGGVSIGNTTDPGATNLSVTGTASASVLSGTNAQVSSGSVGGTFKFSGDANTNSRPWVIFSNGLAYGDLCFQQGSTNAGGTYTTRVYVGTTGGFSVGNTTDAGAGNISAAGTIKTGGYTVAGLPTGVTGARAYVTNALAPTYGATVVGGGAVTIPVFYNGTNWIVG